MMVMCNNIHAHTHIESSIACFCLSFVLKFESRDLSLSSSLALAETGSLIGLCSWWAFRDNSCGRRNGRDTWLPRYEHPIPAGTSARTSTTLTPAPAATLMTLEAFLISAALYWYRICTFKSWIVLTYTSSSMSRSRSSASLLDRRLLLLVLLVLLVPLVPLVVPLLPVESSSSNLPGTAGMAGFPGMKRI